MASEASAKFPTVRPNNLKRVLAELDKLANPAEPLICRGQAKASWRLQPSIDRDVGPGTAYAERLDEERCLLEEFRRRVEHLVGDHEWHHVSQALPNDLILPMTVMQHFSAPTRLLDWTRSPFVAAFFAAVDDLDQDGAVWWCSYGALQKEATKQWNRLGMWRENPTPFNYNPHTFREDSPKFIGPVFLSVPFQRAAAQQGLFTIAGRLGLHHDTLLLDLVGAEHFGKLIVPSQFKRGLLSALKLRGVTAVSLCHVGADRLGFTMTQDRRTATGGEATATHR